MIARVSLSIVCLLLLANYTTVHAAEPETISLTVEFSSDNQKEFTDVKWSAEMTVLDALKACDKLEKGIDFEHRGSGATAFVKSIEGIKNKGAFGPNWVFQVNGAKADKSCGIYKLSAGDKVLWQYKE